MPQPAIMRIDQTGLPVGTAGLSRTDGLDTGAQVTLTDVSGGTTTRFELLWIPFGDTTAVASLAVTGTSTIWTFNPTASVYGSYRIRLYSDEGLPSEQVETRIFGVRLPNTGILIPALNEVADEDASLVNMSADVISDSENNASDYGTALYNAFRYAGWWRSLNELFTAVDAGTGGGGAQNIISPAQITANQDDYSPAGLAAATILRLDTDASRNVSGLDASGLGDVVVKKIINVGANDLVLLHEDAGSSATNRFLISGGANLTLQDNDSADVFYDTVSSRWRVV